ncbi:LysR family transcriptional regulator [Acinetobacter defluvii]|uniref:LysR family transcriptional regulator n=1 Tax=Acinetobacter defluvii TaxID=1871111 RepID=A0A2S2FCP9_9GAMM|nr:LysR family transcriptional regulator [Acinetobacter defluvii]AWL28751.1 LysR family transcriptional regulator [Acinetobacter defluvii]
MELRHLKYFVAVVEQQSFTKAADKLFIAQPPLSRQIQNLEHELGVQLFERGSRPLVTTEAGHFFYQHALHLLSQADELKLMTKRIGVIDRTITLSFVGSLLFGYLSKIIFLFKQRNEHLKIELVEMSSVEQIQALKEGRIDIGFGRVDIPDPAIQRIHLREEPLVIAIHAGHPLARVKEGILLKDLVEEDLIFYPKNDQINFSTQVHALFSRQGLTPQHVRYVREMALACGFAAAGDGIVIVPKSAANIHLTNLKFIPILDPTAISNVVMAIRKEQCSEDLKSFFDCIYQVYDLEGVLYNKYIDF